MNSKVRLVFTGDIAFSGYFAGKENESILEKEICSFFENADEVVANVEAPITTRNIESDRALNHVNNPDIIDFLRRINCRIWNIGNNHIMDCGEDGLRDTLEIANRSNCITIGASLSDDSRDFYTIVEKDGVRIAILSVTQTFYALFDKQQKDVSLKWNKLEKIKKLISELKKKSHWVILVVHGGDEFCDIPMDPMRVHYYELLACGADIIVGHHPHVVQNYELCGDNKAIFYSLGNFIFDTDYQREHCHTESGILLRFNFDKASWSWDYKSIKINRIDNCLTVSRPPVVFRNLSKTDYKKMRPFIAYQSLTVCHSVLAYFELSRKKWSHFRWMCYDLRRIKMDNFRYMIVGRFIYCFKHAKNELEKYLVDEW